MSININQRLSTLISLKDMTNANNPITGTIEASVFRFWANHPMNRVEEDRVIRIHVALVMGQRSA